MRVITLPAGANARYRILHQTLLYSPLQLKREELLTHGRLVEALQAIGTLDPRSEPTEDNPEPVVAYNLIESGGDIVIDESQYGLLKRHVAGMIGSFKKSLSLEVAATIDWLDLLEERQLADLAKATT